MDLSIITTIGVFLYVINISLIDIKKKKVPLWMLLVLIFCGMMVQIISYHGIFNLFYCMLPGLVMLLLGRISSQQVGYGDGLLLLGLGLLLGAQKIVIVLFGALFCSFVVAMILLLTKKGTKKTQIAFFPCVLVGMIFQISLVLL